MWSLDGAKESKYIDEVYVSTDSQSIADVCIQGGVPVPELRPEYLAQDTSSSMDVLLYVIDLMEHKGKIFDYLILLEPTSPIRKNADIDNMIEIAVEHPEADGVISLGRVHTEHPSIVKRINKEGFIIPYIENGKEFYQRQLEDEAFFPYGVGYLVNIDRFKDTHTIYMDKMLPYYIERYQNYEVDDIYDFECISAIMKMEDYK